VAIGDDAAFFHAHCQGMIERVGLHVKSEEILDVIDGHVGQGYGITSQEILGVWPSITFHLLYTVHYVIFRVISRAMTMKAIKTTKVYL